MDASTLAELAADPDRLERVPAEELPDVLAGLERLRAQVWMRMNRPLKPNGSDAPETDRMLNVKQVAEILEVESRYVYDHADDWPFTRKLSPRTLRFSERGLYRWLESRP